MPVSALGIWQKSILGIYIIYGNQGNVSLSLPAVRNSG